MQSTDTPLFRSLTTTRDDLESVIRDQIDLVRQPGAAGWEGRISAAITLPLTGVSAVLVGLAHLTLASTDEEEWRRVFSKTDTTVSDGPVVDTF